MSKIKLILLLCIFVQVTVSAQVKIGDNPNTINSASLLEMETTNKGFVPPRVSLTSLTSPSPLPSGLITGTIVFNTNASLTTGVGIYYWNGSSWDEAATTRSSGSTNWSLTGNSGTNYATNFLGTTDNASLRFRTNNIQRMIIDSLGNVGIGSENFRTGSREKLLVDIGTTTSNTIATYSGSVNNYMQINVQNKNAGNNASSDYVATADDGTDDTLYIDMGINSSGFAPNVENWGNAHDAYLYSDARNLLIGTQAGTAGDIIFLVGGGRINFNTAMRITQGSSNVVIGNRDSTNLPIGNILRGPNASGSGNIPGGTLTIQGGASRGTSKGGQLNLYGGGIGGTGRRGAINMIGDSLYLSGIPATTTLTTDSLLTISNTIVKKVPFASLSSGGGGSGWLLTGNSGTNPSTNFVGTTDLNGLSFKVNNIQAGFLGPVGSSYATSFGVNSNAVYQSTALGSGAQATGSNSSLAVGYLALALNQNSIAIGTNDTASADEGIAIGLQARTNAYRGIAIGSAAKVSGSTQNIAIGYNSNANSFNGIAIGYNSSALTNNNTVAIGVGATASGYISMAMGNSAQATGQNTTAFGYSAIASALNANAFGNASVASGTSSTSLGNSSTATGTSSLVLGDNSLGSGAGSIVVGNNSTAGNTNTIIIGAATTSNQANALILGNTANNVGIGTTTPNTSTKLDVNGNFKLGSTGTVLSGIFRTTVTLDPALISLGGTVTVNATVNGVAQNAMVIINPETNLLAGVSIAWARASAANTITVAFTSTAVFGVDQTSAVYDVTIIQ